MNSKKFCLTLFLLFFSFFISSCAELLEVVDALASLDTNSSTTSVSTTSSVASAYCSGTNSRSSEVNELQNRITSLQKDYVALESQLNSMKRANQDAFKASNAAKSRALKSSGKNYGSVGNNARLNTVKAGGKYTQPYSQNEILAVTKRMSDIKLEIRSLQAQVNACQGEVIESNTSSYSSNRSSSSSSFNTKSTLKRCPTCDGTGKCSAKYGGAAYCNGTGKCGSCGGNGRLYGNSTTQSCPNCQRPGRDDGNIIVLLGNGKCKMCGGTGKCQVCGGTGYK